MIAMMMKSSSKANSDSCAGTASRLIDLGEDDLANHGDKFSPDLLALLDGTAPIRPKNPAIQEEKENEKQKAGENLLDSDEDIANHPELLASCDSPVPTTFQISAIFSQEERATKKQKAGDNHFGDIAPARARARLFQEEERAATKPKETEGKLMEKEYLDVSIQEKDQAKGLGAQWDRARKRWFTDRGNPNFSKLYEIWGCVFLSVPFNDKDEAKRKGARWDDIEKAWYVNRRHQNFNELWQTWPVHQEPLEEFPGEDRKFGGDELFVDLIPDCCWFTNARTCIDPKDWLRVRRKVVDRSGGRCEACRSGERPEVHERWAYDEAKGVQALRRLVCLCQRCHEATHMGLAEIRGRGGAALAHLQAVTGVNPGEAWAHRERAFALWARRNARPGGWELDLSILTRAGVQLRRPAPRPEERASIAVARLAAQQRVDW